MDLFELFMNFFLRYSYHILDSILHKPVSILLMKILVAEFIKFSCQQNHDLQI
jgi:hypothetical protein